MATTVKFPEANRIWKAPEDMENCDDMHAWQEEGEPIISCFKLTWRERFSALFFGKAWHFNFVSRPAPVGILVKKSIFQKVKQNANESA